MPKYLILARTFAQGRGDAGHRIYEQGDVIDFDGIPGKSMAAMDDQADAKKARARHGQADHSQEEQHLRAQQSDHRRGSSPLPRPRGGSHELTVTVSRHAPDRHAQLRQRHLGLSL
jgi:hypothetical protein